MTRLTLLATAAVAALASGTAQAGTLFIARMTGANEVPANPSTFTGTGTLILNDAKTSALVNGSHNITPTTTVVAGHIHRGPAGVNGPVIFPFPNPNAITNLTWAIPAADVVNLEAGGLYFNIHTQARPGGEIRGQLLRATLAPAATNATQAAVAAAMDVSYGFAADLDQALIRTNLAATATQTQALDELSGRSLYVKAWRRWYTSATTSARATSRPRKPARRSRAPMAWSAWSITPAKARRSAWRWARPTATTS
jgi:hypothetical protein